MRQTFGVWRRPSSFTESRASVRMSGARGGQTCSTSHRRYERTQEHPTLVLFHLLWICLFSPSPKALKYTWIASLSSHFPWIAHHVTDIVAEGSFAQQWWISKTVVFSSQVHVIRLESAFNDHIHPNFTVCVDFLRQTCKRKTTKQPEEGDWENEINKWTTKDRKKAM